MDTELTAALNELKAKDTELAAKEARIAELERACVGWQMSYGRCIDNGTGFLARAEAAEKSLGAVSEVLKGYERVDDVDALFAQIRSIVDSRGENDGK